MQSRMLPRVALAVLALATGAQAQLYTYAHNKTYNLPNYGDTGPGTPMQPNKFPVMATTQFAALSMKPIALKSGGPFNYGNTVPVYIIYYTSKRTITGASTWRGYFDDSKRAIIETLINNIGDSTYYSVIRRYGVGKFYVAKIVVAECRTNVGDPYAYGCDIDAVDIPKVFYNHMYRIHDDAAAGNQFAKTAIASSSNYGLPADYKGLYLMIGGPDTSAKFTARADPTNIDPASEKIGRAGQDFCGFHSSFKSGVVRTRDSNNYVFGYVQVPNKDPINVLNSMPNVFPSNLMPASKCFKNQVNTAASPNGDPAIDQSLFHIVHELAEMQTSPSARNNYVDADGLEVADKCEPWINGAQPQSAGIEFNTIIGGKKYFLPSLWDKDRNICTIGGNLYLQGYRLSGKGYKNWPFCVQKIGGADADGRSLEMSGCSSGHNHQVWNFGTDGSIAEQERGFCMTLHNGSTAAGTPVIPWRCYGHSYQKWEYDPYYQLLRSVKDRTKCLTNASWSTNDGQASALTIEPCSQGAWNQVFTFSH